MDPTVYKLLGFSLINWQDHEGRTALHTAIKEANKLVADLLISKNADVKLSDNKARSALHWASQSGSKIS